MAKLNLEKMSVAELKQLQKDAEKAIVSAAARKRTEALAELEAVAKKHGFKLSDFASGKKPRKTASPAKYRHPENSSVTWSGRGRQPKWIKEGLEAGKPLDDFSI